MPRPGVLTFALASNFEIPSDADGNNTYVVVVRATSGTGDRVKTVDQTITVTVMDVGGEAPGVPAAPTVVSAGATSVAVSWTGPVNAGPPVTDYDYQYRVKTPQGSWTEVTDTPIAVLNATITQLVENTEYEVQVRAANAEGTSDWSESGSGSTDANAAPSFTSAAAFDAAENQTAVGTVEASDSDDAVTGYAIEGGADASKFSIDAATGVLTFDVAPNFEIPTDDDGNNTYVVVVRATSGTDDRVKTADQTITVTVTDVGGEAPGVPAAPTVVSTGVSSVTVSWTGPVNAGPTITDYDYQYRVKTTAGAWTKVTNTPITALSATIAQLVENTEYEVQVRAANAEGTSDWSESGSGSTDANAAPSFTSAAAFDAAENQTAVGTIEASDSDDAVTGYAIEGGADASKFSIDAATGVLTFALASNFEIPSDADGNNTYVVVVRATSGTGDRVKTVDQTITVTVMDVGGEAPGVPAAPTVVSAGATSVAVSWTGPVNAGPPVTDYDYQYRVKTPQGSWTEVTDTPIAVLNATITQLVENTEYEVQVRATNAEGTSDWSESGSGSTDANAAPSFTSAAAFDAAENQTAVGTVEASDSDDAVTGYAIEGGADASKFSIDAATRCADVRLGVELRDPVGRRREQHLRGGGAGDERHRRSGEDGRPDDHGDGDGRGRRGAGGAGRADGGVGRGDQCGGVLDRACERRAAGHGLRLPVPGEDAARVVDGGDGYPDRGAERDDHAACGEHRIRGAGARGERRGHERLVRIGQRLDGRERGAVVHLGGGVRRGGEPDRGGDGRGIGQRRRRDGLRDRGRRGRVEVLDRCRDRCADVRRGAELRDPDGRRREQHLRGGGAGDERHRRSGEDGGPDDHGDGDGRGRRGAGGAGRADGGVGRGDECDGVLDRACERRAAGHGLRLPVPVKTPTGSWTEVTDTPITAPSATIAQLAEDTEYEVQVRATNAEGTSDWSESGSGSTDANATPSFTSAAAFDAAENQTAVGTVEASDSDDAVTGYAIEGGADASKFSIDAATGALTFALAPNFEIPTDDDGNNTYVVVVRATSGTDDRVKTADQTITVTVTDVGGEAPGVPAAPTVVSTGASSVAVSWTGPVNAGPPVTDYDYQYRVKTPQGSWTEVTDTPITAPSATIAQLAEDTEYEVQVRATNAEGTSDWSESGSGSTDANATPSFTSAAAFDAAENQTAVGTIEASDSDDAVTGYAIEGGADASSFSIDAATGALTFDVAPNFEIPTDDDGNNTYVVVVRATSGTDDRVKTADQTITVTVTDVGGEAPGVPAAPTVVSTGASSVAVSWTGPVNAGPPVTDYDYQYRVKTPQGSWTEVTDTPITAPSATIAQLAEDTEYEVQVRAANAEGTSDWSESGSGSTDANATPSFTSAAAFDAAENQTAVGTVEASDSDDAVTGYAIAGGADASSFSIDAATGALTFDVAPNFEIPTDDDGNNTYVVVVRATSGTDDRVKTADQTITVTVTDVGGEAPGVPAAPTVVSTGASSVAVSWVRARERRAAGHGLRLPVPGEDDGGGVDEGNEHPDHGSERDDRAACGEHRIRGAGARGERRGHERLVRIGQRLDGRERDAVVHLGGGVRRGGEPDRGGDGRGIGQRRRRDGLRDRGRRGCVEFLD